MCVHRLRAGTVSFKYELNHSGRFVELEPAERTKERAVRSEKIENARAARSAAQEAPAQHQHDGKNIKILIADESTHLPAEFTQFIKHRFG
jgi:hypothetical protein